MVATLFAFSIFFGGIIINEEKSYNKDFSANNNCITKISIF